MNRRYLAIVLVAGTLALPSLASANAFDNIKQSASGMMNSANATQSGNIAGSATLLHELGTGSFNLASMQNVAGVLGYCQKHGYTQSATEQIRNRLLSKLGGQSKAAQSPGYQQGLSGLLQGGQGNQFNLANLKDRIGTRVCGAVAKQALSSFLGK
ncbi:DUF2501 domain-containing protein [Salinisphaera sp. RV14]|uniref:DUF2501 domain-containing protein n=1 Tax=unclassified Salinisphaera TaxID=2649847 RepID=UPI003F83C0ED